MSPTSAPGSIGWEDACRVPKKVSPMNMNSENPATMRPSTRADYRKNGMTSFSGSILIPESRPWPVAPLGFRPSARASSISGVQARISVLLILATSIVHPPDKFQTVFALFPIPSGSAAPLRGRVPAPQIACPLFSGCTVGSPEAIHMSEKSPMLRLAERRWSKLLPPGRTAFTDVSAPVGSPAFGKWYARADRRCANSGYGAFRTARIPIHTPAVAPTDNGLLAPELA